MQKITKNSKILKNDGHMQGYGKMIKDFRKTKKNLKNKKWSVQFF